VPAEVFVEEHGLADGAVVALEGAVADDCGVDGCGTAFGIHPLADGDDIQLTPLHRLHDAGGLGLLQRRHLGGSGGGEKTKGDGEDEEEMLHRGMQIDGTDERTNGNLHRRMNGIG
jgi:hypothetical protein